MTSRGDNQTTTIPARDPDEVTRQDQFVTQGDVIQFLSRGAAFGQVPDERIDTYNSHIFLVGPHAWKLKRSVKLPFVDFTTLEARRAACEREVAINQRMAPDVYLGVVPVTRDRDTLQLDGMGEVVDYMIKMKRIDDHTSFNRLSVKNNLNGTLISDLAEQIAKFHLSAIPHFEFGGFESVKRTLQSVTETLSKFDGTLFSKGSVAAWGQEMNAELLRQARYLDLRRQMGFVRQCHGNLQLDNIYLSGGRPTPFDASELGGDFSTIDVLYDLALPIMDLDCARSFGHANLLLNRYLEVTDDYSGLHVLPLFIALRAGEQAMVQALQFQSGHTNTANRIAALNYFDLAKARREPCEPRLAAIGGVSGSGKSTLARQLAISLFPHEGAIIVRSDAVRKHLFRQSAMVPLPQEAYTEKVDRRVFRACCRSIHRALMSGYSVIVDATFLSSEYRLLLEDLADRQDVHFVGLWLDAGSNVLLDRITRRTSDVSDADKEIVLRQLKTDAGEINWTRIDASRTRSEVHLSARGALYSSALH